jgi:hypothetical protein
MRKIMRIAMQLSLSACALLGSHIAAAESLASRCSQAGVLKCVSFDTDADFSKGSGGTQGAWGSRFGLVPHYSTSDYTRAGRDTTVFANGGGSLKFTIPSNSAADTSGSWFTNFTDDLSYQVGEGQEIFIQWRQRFSPEMLNTLYLANDGSFANGWKLADISAGDTPACTPSSVNSTLCPTSCWDFEVVLQNSSQWGLPQMYANCAGPNAYKPLQGITSNITVQNAVECLYPTFASPPCVKFFPNEWMTFQIHIKVGHWNQWDSTIQLWVARDGQASRLVIDCSPGAAKPCTNGIDGSASTGWYLSNSNPTYKIGKIWLLPYHTNKSPSQTHATAYVWYDDLIIYRNRVADPDPGVRPNPPTNVTAQ